ncbi:hypothetical protein DPMN_088171 [Dreissena polymorpha]|uniref:Exportin-1/Importin-beta-like domain-containing protein n=1 Tax=Dreissena polymorpha TaxID=45954 RepID=A0A9D4QW61_DREPO|nr:hypothetical protein DPMN_088171 [Dreissena polymorpha]
MFKADSDECRQHTKVCVAALQTLEGYLDWVSMANITIKNNLLLEMLCQMLSFPDLQLPAAECMLAIVTKRVGFHF